MKRVYPTGELARHPLSHLYPIMSDGEFRGLVSSMKKYGYDPAFPIILFQWMVADGWHRLRASMEARVEPIFVEWHGTAKDLRAFIVRANSHRRHMTQPQHVQALLRMRDEGHGLTDEQIRQASGASAAVMADNIELRKKNPDRANRVADGKDSLEHARRLEGLATSERRAAATASVIIVKDQRTAKMAQDAADTMHLTFGNFVKQAVQEAARRVAEGDTAWVKPRK